MKMMNKHERKEMFGMAEHHNLNVEYLKSKRRVAELECRINRNENIDPRLIQHENKAEISSNQQRKKEEQKFPASMSHISAASAGNKIISDNETYEQSQEVEEILSLLGVKTAPPSITYQKDSTLILENIVCKIEADVKTAGLRQRKEAVILSSIDDLRYEQEKLRSVHLATLHQWSSYVEECVMKAAAHISYLSKQLLDCNKMKERAEHEALTAREESAQAVTELDVARYKISSIQEEAERVKSDAWEKCAQNKAILLYDFKLKLDDMTQKLQQEKNFIKLSYTHESAIERELIEKGWQEKYKKLEIKYSELRNDASEKHLENLSLKSMLEQYENERQKENVTSKEALQSLRDELTKERQWLLREKEKNEQLSIENKMLVGRLEKSNKHLKEIDVKVKRAFDLKDFECQSAMMQLSMLEKQIRELDLVT